MEPSSCRGAASAGQAEVLLWGPEIDSDFVVLRSETSSEAEVVHPDKGLKPCRRAPFDCRAGSAALQAEVDGRTQLAGAAAYVLRRIGMRTLRIAFDSGLNLSMRRCLTGAQCSALCLRVLAPDSHGLLAKVDRCDGTSRTAEVRAACGSCWNTKLTQICVHISETQRRVFGAQVGPGLATEEL